MGGFIYIAQDFDLALDEIRSQYQNVIVVGNRDKEFLIEHVDEALDRAYIASHSLEIIVLIAPKFSVIAQNKLLKVLEEPPKNKEFILITKSKSTLLPTIKSRLPVKNIFKKRLDFDIGLDLDSLDTESIYSFLKKNRKISKLDAKEIIEVLSISILKSNRYMVDDSLLDYLKNSIKALDLNSNPTFIISGLFLKLLKHKID